VTPLGGQVVDRVDAEAAAGDRRLGGARVGGSALERTTPIARDSQAASRGSGPPVANTW
jgi:hypothetical protein